MFEYMEKSVAKQHRESEKAYNDEMKRLNALSVKYNEPIPAEILMRTQPYTYNMVGQEYFKRYAKWYENWNNNKS